MSTLALFSIHWCVCMYVCMYILEILDCDLRGGKSLCSTERRKGGGVVDGWSLSEVQSVQFKVCIQAVHADDAVE